MLEKERLTPPKVQTTYKHLLREMRGERYVDLAKDTQFSDAWIMLGVVITLLGTLFNNNFLTAAALVLFVIAVVSRVWNEFSLFGLHYHRQFSETRAFLGETIRLTLEVRNQKFIPLTWLQIVDTFPTELTLGRELEGDETNPSDSNNVGELRTFWMVGPFQRLTRHFTVHCTHRGYYTFGPATISTGDGFGLFDRRARPLDQNRIIVYPKLYSMTDLALPAKNPFGEATTRQRLFEDPLRTSGIRQWDSADDLRRIHWKATARHQQLLSRTYEPSHDPQMMIVLNVATLPRYWQGIVPELLERAISVAGSLAAICIERRIPVGLVANGVLAGSDQPIRLLPGRSSEQLTRILELLAAIQPLASGQIEKTVLQEAPRLPWGATLLVVSAVVTEALSAALLELDQAGRQIILFTLAEAPPELIAYHARILVYHLSWLVDDLIDLEEISDDAAH